MRKLSLVSLAFLATHLFAQYTIGEGWKAIPNDSLIIQKGSALDCSRFVENAPAGTFGRVIVNKNGHFAFEKRPDVRVKFFGCSFGNIGVPRVYTKPEIDIYVDAIKTQGFNAVRVHEFENYICEFNKGKTDLDNVKLDLFFYYLSKLKQNGIYIFLDCVTSLNEFRYKTFVDQSARQLWYDFTKKLLTTKNPYTNTILAEDPMVVNLVLFNEMEIVPGKKQLEPAWRDFLKKKYGTMDALRTSWVGKKVLPQGDSFDSISIYTRSDYNEKSAIIVDIANFASGKSIEMFNWFVTQVRSFGYKGLYTLYDYHKSMYLHEVHDLMPIVNMHNYHDHPSSNRISNNCSLTEKAQWWRNLMAMRFTGRPMVSTEYKHVWWNKYRYQEAFVTGGYSSLQDFDMLMAHQQPVKLIQQPLQTFHSTGLDPVSRSAQFLSGYMLIRGYIKPASHSVNVDFRSEDMNNQKTAMLNVMNSEQSLTSLVTGLGVSWNGFSPLSGTNPKKPDITIRPAGGAEQIISDYFVSSMESTDKSFSFSKFVEELKTKNILPKSNKTNPEQGIFESETGEILMNSNAQTLQVLAPNVEGLSFESLAKPISLGQLQIISSSVPANVTLISVDEKPLNSSKRMVLVYATDALNSNMEFETAEMKKAIKTGTLPVLVKIGKLSVSISNINVSRLKVWALALNGKRLEQIPVQVINGKLLLNIDTDKLKDGPATFYEITNN